MQDLKQRIFLDAVPVGKLIPDLPYNTVDKEYFSQIVRRSFSAGANYRAVRRVKSTPGFINKLKIVEEEADESVYFLELFREFNMSFKDRITEFINEGTEVLEIIVPAIKHHPNKNK